MSGSIGAVGSIPALPGTKPATFPDAPESATPIATPDLGVIAPAAKPRRHHNRAAVQQHRAEAQTPNPVNDAKDGVGGLDDRLELVDPNIAEPGTAPGEDGADPNAVDHGRRHGG